MPFLRRHWPILFLALVPLLPMWKAVFAGEAIGPFDQIKQMAPWNGPKPEMPWDVLQADGVLQFYGWRDLVFESWRKGEIPFRNPFQLAGTPLLANSQSGGFYPPHVLIGVLHLPTPLAITLLAWMHLFWAGLGAYFLARKLGAKEIGGVVSGASFAVSAFMIAWLPLASVTTTVAWIPWLLLGTLELMPARPVRTECKSRPVEIEEVQSSHSTEISSEIRGRFLARVARLALCFCMLLLAGHLQFAAYGLMAAAVLGIGLLLSNISSKGSWTGIGGIALAAALGVGMASPQLLPVLQFSKDSHRRNSPTEEGYQAYVGGALAPAEGVGALFPSLLGNPTIPSSPDSPISSYYPALEHRGANFAETAIGIGPMAFIGLLFVPWRRLRPAHLSLAIVGVLAGLIAFGSPIGRLLYFGVPGWSSTGSPGRCGVLLVLAACVLAGAGITRIELERPGKRAVVLALAAGGLLAGLNVLFAFLHASGASPWIERLDPEALRSVAFSALGAALPGLVAILLGCTLGIQAWAKKIRGAEGLLLGAVAFTPLLTLGADFLRTGSPDFAPTIAVPTHERAAFVNDDWQLLAAAPGALMPPNMASVLRIHDIAGYDSLMHRDSVEMIHQIVGGDAAPPANGNMELLKSTFSPEKLAEAGVTRLYSMKPIADAESEKLQSGGLYNYLLAGTGRAYTDQGPAEILEESGSRIVLSATGSHLTVKDFNLPGWSAQIGGQPATLSHRTKWLELDLPPGPNRVVLVYTAPGFTLVPGLISLALVAGLLILSNRAKK